MNVLLVCKFNGATLYYPEAKAVRFRSESNGCDVWVIEMHDDDVQLFTCANWYVYIQYNENK